MNLNPLSFALSQITYLVENLNKKNFKSSQSEIQSLLDLHGVEAERHLFRTLFASIDFSSDSSGQNPNNNNKINQSLLSTSGANSTATGKHSHQIQLLREFFLVHVNRPSFGTILEHSLTDSSNNNLTQISKALKLNSLQDVIFGVLLKNAVNEELKQSANSLIKSKLAELIESVSLTELNEFSLDLAQSVLEELRNSNNNSESSELLNRLVEESSLSELAKAEGTGTMDTSLVDYVQELGYGFTASHEECRNALLSFSSTIKDNLNAVNVARLLSLMARTHNETSESTKDSLTWNSDVLVAVLLEITPGLQWKDVVKEFDHSEFLIKDKGALRLVINAVKRGLRTEQFPIEHIYKTWNNPEGQLSLIIHSIKHPEVFCLSEYPCKKTSTECLKLQPEDDNKGKLISQKIFTKTYLLH